MKLSKGFTLLEIGLVIFIIGILVSMFLPSMTQDFKDKGKVTEIIKIAQINSNISKLLSQECNRTLNYVVLNSASGLLATGYTFSDLLSVGSQSSSISTYVRPAFQACVKRSYFGATSNLFKNSGGYYTVTSLNFGQNVGANNIARTGIISMLNGKTYIGSCFQDKNKSGILKKVINNLDPSFDTSTLYDGYINTSLTSNWIYLWNEQASYDQLCLYDKTQPA